MTKETKPMYSRAELKQLAQTLFGVKPEVVDGALHGDGRNELTVDDARQRINQFLNRRTN